MGPSKLDIPLKIEKNSVLSLKLKKFWKHRKLNLNNFITQIWNQWTLQFATEIDESKVELETLGCNSIQTSLNIPLQLLEVEKAITSCKKNKTRGIYYIPNKVINHSNITKLLFKPFDYCFKIIKFIPKNSKKNPFLPLNYRGISFISCISKIYSSILNNRLTQYLEENKILVDKQNGFRNLDLAKIIYLSYLQ